MKAEVLGSTLAVGIVVLFMILWLRNHAGEVFPQVMQTESFQTFQDVIRSIQYDDSDSTLIGASIKTPTMSDAMVEEESYGGSDSLTMDYVHEEGEVSTNDSDHIYVDDIRRYKQSSVSVHDSVDFEANTRFRTRLIFTMFKSVARALTIPFFRSVTKMWTSILKDRRTLSITSIWKGRE